MTEKIAKHYDSASMERAIYSRWLEAESFRAVPDGRGRERRYVVMMPLPNVTGALHMGHAMDNVLQDLLIRWHRMRGHNTCWMPGTDHAGIATQAIVEKRLFALEGRTRRDIGREALVRRIWEWKEEYQERIIQQQTRMGCSCDWDRHRFTMDPVCTRAVRAAFFQLFRDGLIYRGDRLVNWDCQLQTAVSDDEIVHETVHGQFFYIRYPVIEPEPGEPEYVVVATTRPETLPGDTAVAVHPDPLSELEHLIAQLPQKIAIAPSREKAALEAKLEEALRRKRDLMPRLLKLRDMAASGRRVLVPLLDRPIPLILDQAARPEFGSGCVKITPAHSSDDYDAWKRHRSKIDIVNILNPDGTLNANAGCYAGMDRFEARSRIIEDLCRGGCIEDVEDRELEVGFSDRTKTPIEPYLSRQWFVRMGDVEEGILCGAGTRNEFRSRGLAQAAIDAVGEGYKSPSGRHLKFHPNADRHRETYVNWLAEKRDWCISRQLWWGHRIPIWHGTFDAGSVRNLLRKLPQRTEDEFVIWIGDNDGNLMPMESLPSSDGGRFDLLVCLKDPAAEGKWATQLSEMGLVQDPDVLDTWFSSALWPFSTLGWPDPETADVHPGKPSLGDTNGFGTCLDYYFPGSCLVTGRDIITLWVARMQLMALYLLGDVPFTDCFVHANIQDGKGERMSKSKGNGIDPVDIIEKYGADAMRYCLCDMQTGIQDIRLPVQATSPFTGRLIDLATAQHGRTVFTYLDPDTGEEFDVLGMFKDVPAAKVISERFAVGQAFCTKLWNAARFALMSLEDQEPEHFRLFSFGELEPEDRWILGRLHRTIETVTAELDGYNPAQALRTAREFLWDEFCDWYVELIKPRLTKGESDPRAESVLAFSLDQILRLLHPFVPFVTEAIWQELAGIRPRRGIDSEISAGGLLVAAAWPEARAEWNDAQAAGDMELLQGITRSLRNWRASAGYSPARKIAAVVTASEEAVESVTRIAQVMTRLGGLECLEICRMFERPKTAAEIHYQGMKIFLLDVISVDIERRRLEAAREKCLKGLVQVEKRLMDPVFIDRASSDKVAEHRRFREIAQREIEMLDVSLRDLMQSDGVCGNGGR